MATPKAWIVQVFIDAARRETALLLYMAAFDTADEAIVAVRAAVPPEFQVGEATPANESLTALKLLRPREVRELKS